MNSDYFELLVLQEWLELMWCLILVFAEIQEEISQDLVWQEFRIKEVLGVLA